MFLAKHLFVCEGLLPVYLDLRDIQEKEHKSIT